MKKLDGIIIPAITPFDEKGELRLDYLERNYERWNKTKVRGFMALGSNGEFRSISDCEAVSVLETVSKVVSKDKAFIAGIGRESLYATLKFLDRLTALDLKIDYASVLTPCYFKGAMTDAALLSYYSKIADESPYPVLLYCAPSFANGVCISPKALKQLAEHPNIAGIKDTSKDMMYAYTQAVGTRDDFTVMSGSLGNLNSCLEYGGSGGVLSAANYFPNTCARLYELAVGKDADSTALFYNKLKNLVAQTAGSSGVAGVKAVMNIMGYDAGIPRNPVLPCKQSLVEEFKQVIKDNEELLVLDMP